MMTIDKFEPNSDYETTKHWWGAVNEPAPPLDLIPETTFIIRYNDAPILALSLFLTNCKGVAYLENFVGNPDFKGAIRRDAAQALVDYACNFAAALGVMRVGCLAYRDKLKPRYEQLGMIKTLDNVSSFARDLTNLPSFGQFSSKGVA